MPDVWVGWNVSAVAAIVLTLGAAVGTVIAIAVLWRLRTDRRVMEAAERFEAVELSRVVKRYVPPELQTQRAIEEIAIVKQVIGSRRPRWIRIAMISGVIMLGGAAAAAFSTHRNLKSMTTARLAAKPALNLDVLKTIQGVWGWRADFLQSCPENPQTISLAPDRKKLLVRYAKPHRDGSQSITELDFDVVSAKPDSLVLSVPDSATPANPRSVQVYVQFLDANTYSLARSDKPMGTSGAIVRCEPPQAAEKGVAH